MKGASGVLGKALHHQDTPPQSRTFLVSVCGGQRSTSVPLLRTLKYYSPYFVCVWRSGTTCGIGCLLHVISGTELRLSGLVAGLSLAEPSLVLSCLSKASSLTSRPGRLASKPQGLLSVPPGAVPPYITF